MPRIPNKKTAPFLSPVNWKKACQRSEELRAKLRKGLLDLLIRLGACPVVFDDEEPSDEDLVHIAERQPTESISERNPYLHIPGTSDDDIPFDDGGEIASCSPPSKICFKCNRRKPLS